MSDRAGPLRLGVVGCGTITRQGHLRALRAVPEVEVVALAALAAGKHVFLESASQGRAVRIDRVTDPIVPLGTAGRGT